MTTSVGFDGHWRPGRTPILHTLKNRREPTPPRRRPEQTRHRRALRGRVRREIRPRRWEQHPGAVRGTAPDPQLPIDVTPPIDLDEEPPQVARRADQTDLFR
jgi:hypothetical protein